MSTPRPCYSFNSVIVREPAPSVVKGLRAENVGDPDYTLVKHQHEAYISALEKAGVAVTVLPPLEAFPDSIFVEDPALVFTDGAILLRPGAPSRLGETEHLEPVLREMFPQVLELPAPGYADGGDILVTQHSVMIGLSSRTDMQGAMGLASQLERLGLASEIIEPPKGLLHFKTGCSLLDEETVLVTDLLATAPCFGSFRKIVLPAGEEAAANAVRINDSLFVSAKYERTIEMLDREGYNIVPVQTSEIEKIDAGLSCMSLRWYSL